MKSFILIFLLTISTNLFASDYCGDVLTYNGEKYFLYISPIELIPNIFSRISELRKKARSKDDKNERIIIVREDCNSIRAEWEILNNKLYLVNVYDSYTNENINIFMEEVLGSKFINGKMIADWVVGKYEIGKDILKHSLWLNYYINNVEFSFLRGIIIKEEKYILYLDENGEVQEK